MNTETKKKKSTAERTVEKTLNQKKKDLKSLEKKLRDLGKKVDDFYIILNQQQEVEDKMKKEAEILGKLKEVILTLTDHQNKLELEIKVMEDLADGMIKRNDELEVMIEKKQSQVCPMCIPEDKETDK